MSLIRALQSIRADFKSTLTIINQIIKNDHSKFDFNFALVATNGLSIKSNINQSSLESIFDGFLWSAPKQRRAIQVRLRRKFGYWNKWAPRTKMLKKKHDLMICDECGSYHEMLNICQVCYLKVKEETNSIQKAIMEKLGLKPVEKEVKLKYQNEKIEITDDKYFIEIPKERPEWFASNLISNTVPSSRETKKVGENTDLEFKIVDK